MWLLSPNQNHRVATAQLSTQLFFTFGKAVCIDVEDEHFFDFHGNLFFENPVCSKTVLKTAFPLFYTVCFAFFTVFLFREREKLNKIVEKLFF